MQEIGTQAIDAQNMATEDVQGRKIGWKDYLVYYAGYTVLCGVTAAAVFCWFWFTFAFWLAFTS